MLYIVATPIGNLSDITLRALDTLKQADGIICEDTRRTSILLNHYQIPKKPLYVLNDFNEVRKLPSLLEQLKQGRTLALVSDAGTPLISDPGYKLVRQCINLGISVDSIPGPSSVITALTLSGLPPDKFLFLGYPPQKPGKRLTFLKEISSKDIKVTIILFIAPHKLKTTLEEIAEVFGDIEVVLAKELTKIHQKVEKKTISRWLDEKSFKGEIILLFRLTP